LPFQLTIACPAGYEPDKNIFKRGTKEGDVTLYRSPSEAAAGADVIYTDVWASMGKEDESAKRATVFKDYQVNTELISHAKDGVIIMHCLPAHRGEEIIAEVMDGPHSVVLDQAENRLHVQKAILEILM
jgi:ornithine carbamoyltransferase